MHRVKIGGNLIERINHEALSSITEFALNIVFHFPGDDVSDLWSIWYSQIFDFTGEYSVATERFVELE